MSSTTPEPELNVEAELERALSTLEDAIIAWCDEGERDIALMGYPDADGKEKRRARRYVMYLIQQVSDQRVRDFAASAKQHFPAKLQKDNDLYSAHMYLWYEHKGRNDALDEAASAIDQTLTDYLSHKEPQ